MPNKLPVGKTHWLAVILLWFAGISAAMQFAKFSISYDALLLHYQAGATLTGAALSVVGVVGLILGVSAGMLAGRLGYLNVLICALLIGALVSFVQSFLPSFNVVLMTRVLEGFSQLGVVVAAPTLISRLSADQHRSLTMGMWGTFFGVAFALSGWLGVDILKQYGLSTLFGVHGTLILSMAVILFFLLRKHPVLAEMLVSKSSIGFWAQLLAVYRNPRCLLPSAVFLCYTCSLVSLLTYIPRMVTNEVLASSLMIILPLISTSGSFIAGALAQYWLAPTRVALVAYSGVAISACILLIVSHEAHYFALVTGVLILFLGMIPGASLAMIPLLARNPEEQAQGYGLIAQFGNLGATIGPPSFALLISLFSLNGMVGLIWLVCLAGISLSFVASGMAKANRTALK
ncbi:MFS transporter [Marinomonas epiphytica]